MDSVKGLLKSKVFWFNVITAVLEVINLFQGILPPGVGIAITTIGNVALRFVTTESLADKVK